MAFQYLHQASSKHSRWWFLLAFLSLFQDTGIAQTTTSDGHSHVTPKTVIHHYKKNGRHSRKHLRSANKPALIQSQITTKIQPPMKLHTPRPGAGGEEHSNWFYQRRAWPNQTIDPSFYPNALAQAAKMPVLSQHIGKDGTLASMQWQSIGPNSIDGRVTCVATHPTDSNTFYVGAAAGGLWKTTDHGSSWTCVTDTFGSLSIGCVTIDPMQPQTIYIGLGECNESGDSYPGDGLWKSTDGGNSWSYLGFAAEQYIAKVLVDPRNHEQLFVASPGPNSPSDTNRGIFRSTDGGATWTRSLSGGVTYATASGCTGDSIRSSFIDLAMNPLNSGELVAAAWDHSLTIGAGFCPGGSGGPNTGIYRSTDTGKTWARIDTLSNGLPNGKNYGVLGRIALLWTMALGEVTTPDYLFAGYIRTDTNPVTHDVIDENFEGLYRSSDEGVTWTKVLDSTIKIPMGGIQNKDSANITNAQGGYDFFLAAGPIRSPIGMPDIYIGGIDIFRSTDLGQTWKDITDSYLDYYAKDNREQHSDQHGLAFTAAPSGTDMIVVSDGGVFHTHDFGTTWAQTTGLPITMFYTVNPWVAGMANTPSTIAASDLKVLGGTQDNGTVAHGLTSRSQSFATDSDFAWINQGDGGVIALLPTDSNKMVTSAAIGGIFARNTLDSLVPNPLGGHDTTHDTLPRWHTLSYRLLYGPHGLTDTNESAAFVIPLALDEERPTDLYTGRCHVYHAVLDWSDLENTKWYTWSPAIAGDVADDSLWYYGDIETIALGPRDDAGNPMIWAGGFSAINGAEVWRTYVNPARADTTPPKWVSKKTGVPAVNVAQIVPDRGDSLTAFLCTSAAAKVDHVMKTINGGTKWTDISGNLPESPVSAIVIDTLAEQGNPLLKNQAIMAATDVGVYVTTNGGAQWEQLGTGLPHMIVTDLKIYKNMLIASVYGRSLWALDISGLQAVPAGVASNVSSDIPPISIFPNPVIGSQAFSVSLTPNERPVTSCLLIQESSGQEFDATIQNNAAGSYNILPATKLSSGAYLVQIFNENQLIGQGRVSIIP
jgi:photosystem II stability/assembly factor-like uncharacterized protein